MEQQDENTSPMENRDIPKSNNKDQVDPNNVEEPKGSAPESSNAPRPDDVLCDSCIETPTKALKSCLTCLVSYCKGHLRPHLENAKFQNHRLVEPLHDIECRSCEVHQFPLDLFCVTDGCCMCRECESQGHQGHTTAPAVEARKQIETELQKKQGEIVTTLSTAEKAIDKLQSNNASVETSVAGIRTVIEQQFGILQTFVEEARRGAVEVLEGEQRGALRQAEGIQAHMEQRRAELKKTLVQIERLSRNKTDVDFLQEYSEWKKGVVDVDFTGVYIDPMDHLESFSRVLTECTQELGGQILTIYIEKLQEICINEKPGIKHMVNAEMPEDDSLSLPDPETREDFVRYSSSLSFDPDTTHYFLRLTEDNRKVTNTSPWQHSYPNNPARFEHWRQVMTSESLYMGRHYIEVEMNGEGAHVGVTCKNIDRKSEESSGCITGNDFSWCLSMERRSFSVWHDNVETPLEVSGITRVGIYIDFIKGSITFYNVTGSMTLLYKYKAVFMEPLYATAWLSKKDNMVFLVSASDPLPQKSPPAGP